MHETSSRSDEQGVHFHFKTDNQAIRLVRLSGVPTDAPLAALVPLDASGLDRVAALEGLLRALQGQTVPSDQRLTPQQKRRQRLMLWATDGHNSGASYREIATVLFGRGRVASEPWKTSSLRARVIALVKDGQELIGGGYRRLLRHRRKDSARWLD